LTGPARAAAPERRVLDRFQALGVPMPLPGGQRTAWRCGDVVLKPLDTTLEMLRWQARVLGSWDDNAGVRVAPPLQARDGSLCVEGWTAWPFLPGEPATGRWRELLDAGARFHAALRKVPRPGFLEARSDRWAVADRMAWGELALSGCEADERVSALARRLAPGHLLLDASQVVHGDLTGNVLLHPDLPPAVLDVSPYWRPPAYASAVVVADALLWHDADEDVLTAAADVPDLAQVLLRALLFRLVTEILSELSTGLSNRPPAPHHAIPRGRYRKAVDIACALADGGAQAGR